MLLNYSHYARTTRFAVWAHQEHREKRWWEADSSRNTSAAKGKERKAEERRAAEEEIRAEEATKARAAVEPENKKARAAAKLLAKKGQTQADQDSSWHETGPARGDQTSF